MKRHSRPVLALNILDPVNFFTEFIELIDRDSSVQVEVDGVEIGQAEFRTLLEQDRFDDVVNLRIFKDGSLALSFHDSIEDCIAEISVIEAIDQLSRRSLLSYQESSVSLSRW